MNKTLEKICVCGCSEEMHVDGCEQCFNGGCSCQEFEERESPEEEKIRLTDELETMEMHYAGIEHDIESSQRVLGRMDIDIKKLKARINNVGNNF